MPTVLRWQGDIWVEVPSREMRTGSTWAVPLQLKWGSFRDCPRLYVRFVTQLPCTEHLLSQTSGQSQQKIQKESQPLSSWQSWWGMRGWINIWLSWSVVEGNPGHPWDRGQRDSFRVCDGKVCERRTHKVLHGVLRKEKKKRFYSRVSVHMQPSMQVNHI